VKALELARVDPGHAEAAEAGAGVVEPGWPIGEPESGQVEPDAAQSSRRELGQHFAVEERRRRHAVQADHWLAFAVLAHEAADPGRGDAAARRTMRLDHLALVMERGRPSASVVKHDSQ